MLQYIPDLKKDTYTEYYFKGFSNESSYEVALWDPILAAKATGFIKESKFCSFSLSTYLNMLDLNIRTPSVL